VCRIRKVAVRELSSGKQPRRKKKPSGTRARCADARPRSRHGCRAVGRGTGKSNFVLKVRHSSGRQAGLGAGWEIVPRGQVATERRARGLVLVREHQHRDCFSRAPGAATVRKPDARPAGLSSIYRRRARAYKHAGVHQLVQTLAADVEIDPLQRLFRCPSTRLGQVALWPGQALWPT